MTMPRILRSLWGDLSPEEFKKFGILSLVIALILGNYWMLRTTKNDLFNILVGYKDWQPTAKILSVAVMIFVVLGYSKLVDLFSKHRLIYLLCAVYGFLFMALSFFIANPDMVSLSETSALYPLVSWIPGKALGWFAYVFLESYGSVMVTLFFSFVASVVTTSSAKKGYGMMTTIIQFGTLSGILFSMYFVKAIGIHGLYFVGSLIILSVPLVMKYYTTQFPQDVEETPQKAGSQKKKTGFFEGIKLIATRPYVIGIFAVVAFYEIISTIVEYQMNYLAADVYGVEGGGGAFTVFTGYQALGINGLALIFAFIGTSFFMRKFGLRFCLTAFPLTVATVVIVTTLAWYSGIGSYPLMWFLLAASVAMKGLNYALNKPTSEVMYIPTSRDVKFKAKGWIDTFGNRSTKGMGAVVTNTFKYSFPALMLYGTIISLGVIGVWFLLAQFVGNTFNKLQKEDKIVE